MLGISPYLEEKLATKLLRGLASLSTSRYLKQGLRFMKTPSRRDHPRATIRRNQSDCCDQGGSAGRWEFNLASENLFALGSTEAIRRAAYRTADGYLRFLPL